MYTKQRLFYALNEDFKVLEGYKGHFWAFSEVYVLPPLKNAKVGVRNIQIKLKSKAAFTIEHPKLFPLPLYLIKKERVKAFASGERCFFSLDFLMKAMFIFFMILYDYY